MGEIGQVNTYMSSVLAQISQEIVSTSDRFWSTWPSPDVFALLSECNTGIREDGSCTIPTKTYLGEVTVYVLFEELRLVAHLSFLRFVCT